MKSYLFVTMMLLSGLAFAGGPTQGDKTENGNGPLQDHTCQGGHNCNGGDNGSGSVNVEPINVNSSSSAANLAANIDVSSTNQNLNANTNVAYGGQGGQGGQGGSAIAVGQGGNAEQSQGQNQGQSQGQNQGQSQSVSNSGNSANYNSQSNSGNNSSQSTNLNFESTGEAKYYNRYGNNVSAYAPAIYSSSACTAGGLSGGLSAFGAGVSMGGAKQDPQCQVRENARILASLDANLALMYLCANPTVDVGKVLGTACKPQEQPIMIPEQPKPEQPKPEAPVVTEKVKG